MSKLIPVNADTLKVYMKQANRDNFSIKALEIIIEFYEQFEENTKFDPVRLDCSFIEYNLTDPQDLKDFILDYKYLVEGEEFEDQESKAEAILEKLQEETHVLSSEWDCVVFDYNF